VTDRITPWTAIHSIPGAWREAGQAAAGAGLCGRAECQALVADADGKLRPQAL